MAIKEPIELKWTASGLTYAGLAWGKPDQPVVIALHGWLDNALSFVELAPLLEEYRVVALDLSGHGLSDHRSEDSGYHLWDEIPQLVDVVEQIAKGPVVLLGHSRGASVAILLAAGLADQCEALVLVDGLLPAFGDDRNGAHQVARYVKERKKYLARPERVFASVEEFAERRKQYGFSPDSGIVLAPRALEACEGGFRLRVDPRLFGASALYINREQRSQIYNELEMPVLSLLAGQGLFANSQVARDMVEQAGRCIVHFKSTTLEGSHHLHMEPASVGQVAQCIRQFLIEARAIHAPQSGTPEDS